MRNAITIVGAGLLLFGLVALFRGVTSMTTISPCFAGDGDCTSNFDGIILFPLGLTAVIIGCMLWIAGAGWQSGSKGSRNPLAAFGFFSIFGLTFFGIGAAMWLADQQPNADHTTNVLTILGIIFAIVGLASIGVEIWMRLAGRRVAELLATGIHGTGTVTAVRDTNVTVNMNPMIALDLRVEIPGQPVTTTTVRTVVSRLQVGSYRPGIVLAVVADRNDPTKVVVDWDHSPVAGTGDDAAGEVEQQQDLAAHLRALADQVEAGEAASGQGMPPAEVAEILRRVSGTTSGAPGQASASHQAPMPESSMPSMPIMPLISSPAPLPATPPHPDDPAATHPGS